MDEPQNQIPESEYRYVFEEGFLCPLSGNALKYIEKAEEYRLAWKKDMEAHGNPVTSGWTKNTCFPIRRPYKTIDQQKVEDGELRRENIKKNHNMDVEDYENLSDECKRNLWQRELQDKWKFLTFSLWLQMSRDDQYDLFKKLGMDSVTMIKILKQREEEAN